MSFWKSMGTVIQFLYLYGAPVWFAWHTLRPRPNAQVSTTIYILAQVMLTALYVTTEEPWIDTLCAAILVLFMVFNFEVKRQWAYMAYLACVVVMVFCAALATFARVLLLPDAPGSTFTICSPAQFVFSACSFAASWGIITLAGRVLRRYPVWRKLPAWLCWVLIVLDLIGQFGPFISPPATRPPVGISIVIALAAAIIYVAWSLWNIRQLNRRQVQLLSQQQLQDEYLNTLRANRNLLHVIRHDMANHIQTALLLLKQGKIQEVQAYLEQLDRTVHLSGQEEVCENLLVNAVVVNKQGEAARQDVQMDIQLHIPYQLGLPGMELVSLLSNLLDNALHNCQAGDCITLEGTAQGGLLTLQVRNPLHGATLPRRIVPPEDDTALHGYGLYAAYTIAKRHGGTFTLQAQQDQAVALVTLYLDHPIEAALPVHRADLDVSGDFGTDHSSHAPDPTKREGYHARHHH